MTFTLYALCIYMVPFHFKQNTFQYKEHMRRLQALKLLPMFIAPVIRRGVTVKQFIRFQAFSIGQGCV